MSFKNKYTKERQKPICRDYFGVRCKRDTKEEQTGREGITRVEKREGRDVKH
jgi:hypothetical protein